VPKKLLGTCFASWSKLKFIKKVMTLINAIAKPTELAPRAVNPGLSNLSNRQVSSNIINEVT
jgi:hypothetical protein